MSSSSYKGIVILVPLVQGLWFTQRFTGTVDICSLATVCPLAPVHQVELCGYAVLLVELLCSATESTSGTRGSEVCRRRPQSWAMAQLKGPATESQQGSGIVHSFG